jgi:hypothetical protein
VSVNFQTDSVSVLLNRGNRLFSQAVSYAVGDGPVSLAAGDLNGDSHPDLITSDVNSETVTVLLNDGRGIFQKFASFVPGEQPNCIGLADLDGDQSNDVIAANAMLMNRSRVSLAASNSAGEITLKWPAHAYSGTLEAAPLGFDAWHALTNRINPEGAENTITLPVDQTQQFFRLRLD